MSSYSANDMKRYKKQKRKVKSQIERYLSGQRKNSKVCMYVRYVAEIEEEYGIRLKRVGYVSPGVGMYKIFQDF